jgi:hypothetical protein
MSVSIGPGATQFTKTLCRTSSRLSAQPACPAATHGTITGTITAANVTGPTNQGIAPGDLNSALEAVRDGVSYANMHTTMFPASEIRGQVRRGEGHGEGSD